MEHNIIVGRLRESVRQARELAGLVRQKAAYSADDPGAAHLLSFAAELEERARETEGVADALSEPQVNPVT